MRLIILLIIHVYALNNIALKYIKQKIELDISEIRPIRYPYEKR